MNVIILLVSGKKQSGKDTFSNVATTHLQPRQILVQRVALADQLKDTAISLFSLTPDQVYDNDKKELPDKRYPIKDFHLATRLGMTQVSYNVEISEVTIKGDYQIPTKPGVWLPHTKGTPYGYLTPRLILKKLGTDVAREIYPDIWVTNWWRIVESMIHSAKYIGVELVPTHTGTKLVPTNHVIVCTDVRFPNEINLPLDWTPRLSIKSGCTIKCVPIRIERKNHVSTDTHESEIGLDAYKFKDKIIGEDLDTYKQQIRDFLDKRIVPLLATE